MVAGSSNEATRPVVSFGGLGRGGRALYMMALTIIVIAGLRLGKDLLVPVVLAAFLAIVCLPLVHWLQARRVPTALAVILVVLVVLALIGVGFVVIVDQLIDFANSAGQYEGKLSEYVTGFLDWLKGHGIELAPPGSGQPWEVQDLVRKVGWAAGTAAGVLSSVGLVLLTMIFMLFEASGLAGKVRRALGDPDADLSKGEEVTKQVYAYLGLKTVVSLLTGLCFTVWLTIIGVDYAVLWGFIAFVFNYIPNIGSLIAAVPPTILAFLQGGPGLGALAAGGNVVVNQVLGNVVEPRLMGAKLGLSTLVVWLSLVFWSWLWGPIGMFLSVPLTMVVKIMLENSDDFRFVAVLLGPSGGASAATEDEASAAPTA